MYYSLAAVGFGLVGAAANAFDLLGVDVIDRKTFIHFYIAPVCLVQEVFKFAIPDIADKWYLGEAVQPEWASSALWRSNAMGGAMACVAYVMYPTVTLTKFYWFYSVLSFAFFACYVNLVNFNTHPMHLAVCYLSGVTFLGFWLSTHIDI